MLQKSSHKYSDDFFDLLFGSTNTSFGAFSRKHSHTNDVNHCFLSIFNSKVTGSFVVKVGPQGVSYSKKFRGKRGFPNLANSRTYQFTFPKYLIEYQNVKVVK